MQTKCSKIAALFPLEATGLLVVTAHAMCLKTFRNFFVSRAAQAEIRKTMSELNPRHVLEINVPAEVRRSPGFRHHLPSELLLAI